MTTSFFLKRPIFPWHAYATEKAALRLLHSFCVRVPSLSDSTFFAIPDVVVMLSHILAAFERRRIFPLHFCNIDEHAVWYLHCFGFRLEPDTEKHGDEWSHCYSISVDRCLKIPLFFAKRKARVARLAPEIEGSIRAHVDSFHLTTLVIVAWSGNLVGPRRVSALLPDCLQLPLPWPVEDYKSWTSFSCGTTREHNYKLHPPNFILLPLR